MKVRSFAYTSIAESSQKSDDSSGQTLLNVDPRWHTFQCTKTTPILVFVLLLVVHIYPGLFGASVILLDHFQGVWLLAAGLTMANRMPPEPATLPSSRFVLAVCRGKSNEK